MNSDARVLKFSDDELAFGRPIGRHLAIGLKALCIPFVLSGMVLAGGGYLSRWIIISPHSILFDLWPFNRIYLQQFASSSYGNADIRWFFTVVSCSNLVWLIFLGWKLCFELLRRDVAFPRRKSPRIFQFILRFLIVGFVVSVLWGLIALEGFSAQNGSLLFACLKQPITTGAIKIVMMTMFFLYVGAAFILNLAGWAYDIFCQKNSDISWLPASVARVERSETRRGGENPRHRRWSENSARARSGKPHSGGSETENRHDKATAIGVRRWFGAPPAGWRSCG